MDQSYILGSCMNTGCLCIRLSFYVLSDFLSKCGRGFDINEKLS